MKGVEEFKYFDDMIIYNVYHNCINEELCKKMNQFSKYSNAFNSYDGENKYKCEQVFDKIKELINDNYMIDIITSEDSSGILGYQYILFLDDKEKYRSEFEYCINDEPFDKQIIKVFECLKKAVKNKNTNIKTPLIPLVYINDSRNTLIGIKHDMMCVSYYMNKYKDKHEMMDEEHKELFCYFGLLDSTEKSTYLDEHSNYISNNFEKSITWENYVDFLYNPIFSKTIYYPVKIECDEKIKIDEKTKWQLNTKEIDVSKFLLNYRNSNGINNCESELLLKNNNLQGLYSDIDLKCNIHYTENIKTAIVEFTFSTCCITTKYLGELTMKFIETEDFKLILNYVSCEFEKMKIGKVKNYNNLTIPQFTGYDYNFYDINKEKIFSILKFYKLQINNNILNAELLGSKLTEDKDKRLMELTEEYGEYSLLSSRNLYPSDIQYNEIEKCDEYLKIKDIEDEYNRNISVFKEIVELHLKQKNNSLADKLNIVQIANILLVIAGWALVIAQNNLPNSKLLYLLLVVVASIIGLVLAIIINKHISK